MRLNRNCIMLALSFTLLLLMGGTITLAQGAGLVRLDIYAVDHAYYPDVEVTFSAYHTQSGRAVENLTADVMRVTHNGQPVEIVDLQVTGGAGRPVHLVVCFDLTSSVSGDYLNEQKRAAQLLIDELAVNDQVGIVTFDDTGARSEQSLTLDHGAVLNKIDELAIVYGASNQFRDGVYESLVALQSNPDQQARHAVVVLTDVTNPQGTHNVEETVRLANTLPAAIHLIGFGETSADLLNPYASSTGGFVYLERELDEGLGRLAEDLAVVLSQEYVLALRSTQPADGSSGLLNVTVDLSGGASGAAQPSITAPPRPIQISFPDLENAGPLSGDVPVEPQISYMDNGEPVTDVSISYSLEQGGNDDGSLFHDVPSSDIDKIWKTEDLAGGFYTILAEVTDSVTNSGIGRVQVEIASPLRVYFADPFFDPADPAVDSQEEVLLGPGIVTITVVVESSYAVNEVILYVDNEQIGNALTTDPYQFTWDTGSETAAGLYALRAEATDVNGAAAQAEMATRVPIADDLTLPLLILLAGLVVLVGVGLAIARVRGRQAVPPVGVAVPEQAGPTAALVAVRPSTYNNYPFLLKPDGATFIGRSSSNDIQVFGQSASREHARVVGSNGVHIYSDVQPNNPSRINGQPLRGEHYLREGDRVVISETELVFTQNYQQPG